MNKKIRLITRTAIMLAMLLVMQFLTKLTGIQLLTGSVVNLLLILATAFCGLFGGLVLGVLSPILAFLLGITPLASFVLVPFIILGNVTYVLGYYFLSKPIDKLENKYVKYVFIILMVVAISFAKYLVINITMLKICLPYILSIKPTKAHDTIINNFTIAYSLVQFFSALIGGSVSLFIPMFKKSLKKVRL